MPYIVISDYKAGLDTRRSELSSRPGTLLQLNNAHITEGGQIEKRKAMVQTLLPRGTFGLQESEEGIYVFGDRTVLEWDSTDQVVLGDGVTGQALLTYGTEAESVRVGDSILIAGSSVPAMNGVHTVVNVGTDALFITLNNTPIGVYSDPVTITLNFSAPFLYQALVHPIVGVTMTGVISSTLFADKIFVIVQWSNGDVFAYYDSTLIEDFVYGEQSNVGYTPYAIAVQLAAQLNASGKYTTHLDPLPLFLYFQVTGGTSSPGVNTIGAVFYLFGRDVTLNGTTAQAFNLLDVFGNVDWTTSNADTVTALITAINTNTYGFVASLGSPTNTVKITPPAVDDNGNVLGLQDTDTLQVFNAGDVQIFIPILSETFEVFSIPDNLDVHTYSVDTIAENGALPYQLVAGGSLATAPTNAYGQFTIVQGGANAKGTGTLTVASLPLNNDTVTINGVIYTFVTNLTTVPNQILIAASANTTLGNFSAALNGQSGAGTKYSNSTLPSVWATATAPAGSAITVSAINNGTPGNFPVSSSSARLVWTGLSGGALAGGTNTNQIKMINVGSTDLLATLVPFNQSLGQTAVDVTAAINAFQGTSGFKASNTGAVITLITVDGTAAYNQAVLRVDCLGNVCTAKCFFQVALNTTGTRNITDIVDGAGVHLIGTTLVYSTSIATYCALIATTINGLSGTSGYLAFATASQVYISKATVTSADDDPIITVVNGAGLIITQGPTTALTASAAGSSTVYMTEVVNNPRGNNIYQSNGSPNSAVVVPLGGTAPYTYVWTGTVDGKIKGSTPNQWWYVSKAAAGPLPTTDTAICTVTDALSVTAVVTFTLVYL